MDWTASSESAHPAGIPTAAANSQSSGIRIEQEAAVDWKLRRGEPQEPLPQLDQLDQFRADLGRLRLTLQSDLSAAAAAVEADQHEIAREIVAADRYELVEFTTRRLQDLDRATPALPAPKARRARRHPALGLAAAAAAVGLLAAGAALGITARSGSAHRTVAAPLALSGVTASLDSFRNTVLSDRTDPSAVLQAATALRASLLPLLSDAPANPAAAREATAVLQAEEQILATVRPAGLAQVMSEVAVLLAQLSAVEGSHSALPVSPTPGAPAVTAASPRASAQPRRPYSATDGSPSASKPKPAPTPRSDSAATPPSTQASASPSPAPSNSSPTSSPPNASLPVGVSEAP